MSFTWLLLDRRSDIHLITDIFELGCTCIVCHEIGCGNIATGGAGCGAHWTSACDDRFGSAVVSIDCVVASDSRVVPSTEGVLALSLHVEQVASALLSWGILVGHSWLHDSLQSLAFASKFVHYIILHLKSVLKIVDHSLFNFLQLLNALFVCQANPLMFLCSLLMRHRHITVVILSIHVFVVRCVSALVCHIDLIIHFLVLVHVPCLEALISEILALSLQVLSDVRVVEKHAVSMASDSLEIGVSPCIVCLSLMILVCLHVHLVPVQHCVVLIAPIFHLICKLRVLLSNPDLFLQPLLLIVKLSQAIFEHLRLDLFLFHVQLLAEFA